MHPQILCFKVCDSKSVFQSLSFKVCDSKSVFQSLCFKVCVLKSVIQSLCFKVLPGVEAGVARRMWGGHDIKFVVFLPPCHGEKSLCQGVGSQQQGHDLVWTYRSWTDVGESMCRQPKCAQPAAGAPPGVNIQVVG